MHTLNFVLFLSVLAGMAPVKAAEPVDLAGRAMAAMEGQPSRKAPIVGQARLSDPAKPYPWGTVLNEVDPEKAQAMATLPLATLPEETVIPEPSEPSTAALYQQVVEQVRANEKDWEMDHLARILRRLETAPAGGTADVK